MDFEKAVEAQKTQLMRELMAVPDGDAIRHAAIKNKILGLTEAVQIYRKAARVDDED